MNAFFEFEESVDAMAWRRIFSRLHIFLCTSLVSNNTKMNSQRVVTLLHLCTQKSQNSEISHTFLYLLSFCVEKHLWVLKPVEWTLLPFLCVECGCKSIYIQTWMNTCFTILFMWCLNTFRRHRRYIPGMKTSVKILWCLVKAKQRLMKKNKRRRWRKRLGRRRGRRKRGWSRRKGERGRKWGGRRRKRNRYGKRRSKKNKENEKKK